MRRPANVRLSDQRAIPPPLQAGKAYPWPPAKTIDRDLSMAVSQFAPLSEVVRDGRVHPAVGVAAFRPSGGKAVAELDPLGPERRVAVCRTCSYLAEDQQGQATCPQCGAGPDHFQEMTLREPLGFRAGKSRDFDGNFSWTARAMAARALTDLGSLSKTDLPEARVYAGPGARFVINDNGGLLFAFQKAARWQVLGLGRLASPSTPSTRACCGRQDGERARSRSRSAQSSQPTSSSSGHTHHSAR